MSLPTYYTRLTLAERPTGPVSASTFKTEKVELKQDLKDGEMLLRIDYCSMDPAMRGWLNDTRSYIEPVKIGEVMRAGALATVVKSKSSKFKVGDSVKGLFGWSEYLVTGEKGVEKFEVPQGATALDFLGPLGSSGMTAYFGLFDVGNIKAGETLVVSGAAGSVGSLVCQLGKLKGAKVIAIAGSNDKVEWLEKELGVDKALNYKSETFTQDFKEAVGYLDVYFDNVGGEILDLCLTRLKKGARIPLCGAISAYNAVGKPRGLEGYLNLISQRAKIEGFIVFDYAHRYKEAEAEMAKWLQQGKLKRKFHIIDGIENAPEGMNMLFSGANTGKLVVNVSKTISKL